MQLMQQRFSRFAGDCHIWLDEAPNWATLKPVGTVQTYWRWPDRAPAPGQSRVAAWGFRVGFGGHGAYGVLGARFEPHEYPYLRVAVEASTQMGRRAPAPFDASTVGLPLELAGGVLAGAVQEAERLGPGTVKVGWGAVHPVDSSWEAFRVLAVGLARLLALPPGAQVPDDLLPYFGADEPAPPGPAA